MQQKKINLMLPPWADKLKAERIKSKAPASYTEQRAKEAIIKIRNILDAYQAQQQKRKL